MVLATPPTLLPRSRPRLSPPVSWSPPASFQPGAATSDADLDLLIREIRVTHSEHTLRARCDGYAAFYDGADAVCRGVCRAMILLARSGQTAEEKTRCLLPLRQLFRGLRRSMS